MKKILMSTLVIALSVVLVFGATQAWFTDENELPTIEFVAGTVEVEAELITENITNVNPGDEYDVEWLITNAGTKAAELRVLLGEEWFIDQDNYLVEGERLARLLEEFGVANIEELEALLNTDNVSIAFSEGWVLNTDDGYLYYVNGPVIAGDVVPLILTVTFDGPLTDNKYMGATFTIGGTVFAIQSSNNAPAESGWNIPGDEEPEEPEEPSNEITNFTTAGPSGQNSSTSGGQTIVTLRGLTISGAENLEGLFTGDKEVKIYYSNYSEYFTTLTVSFTDGVATVGDVVITIPSTSVSLSTSNVKVEIDGVVRP